LLPASKASVATLTIFLLSYALQIHKKYRGNKSHTQTQKGVNKMAQLPTRQIGAYLRKMAIDGLIIYTDTSDIREMNKELHSIGININQVAKQFDETNSIYQYVDIPCLSSCFLCGDDCCNQKSENRFRHTSELNQHAF